MGNRNVTIYVSDGCTKCKELLTQMDEWNIPYQEKNISKRQAYLEELQDLGLYGTPVTFIEGEYKAILGFQKNKIKNALGIRPTDFI